MLAHAACWLAPTHRHAPAPPARLHVGAHGHRAVLCSSRCAGYKDDPKPLEKSIDMMGKMLVRRRTALSHLAVALAAEECRGAHPGVAVALSPGVLADVARGAEGGRDRGH